MIKTQVITKNKFNEYINDAEKVICEGGNVRLIFTKDNHIIKVFKQRKLISSNRLFPYGKRFYKNAKTLKNLGFKTIDVVNCQRIKGTQTYLVKYKALQGQDLRERLDASQEKSYCQAIAEYVAKLHQAGIFFRGIHLGNILESNQGEFALIDISSVKTYKQALPDSLCKRNLDHLLYRKDDQKYFDFLDRELFLNYYNSVN